MIKLIQVGLLSLLILLLSYQEGMAAPSKKPISKDTEFNDPLLEEEALDEQEEEELEKEALKARGDVPLEENKLPDPPKKKPEVTPQVSVPNSNLSPQVEAKTEKPEVLIDSDVGAIVNMGDSTPPPEEPRPTTAALPRWDPQDPHKGFIKSDEEDGGYYYKEDSADNEREVKEDYKIVPRNSNYKRGLLYVSSDGSYVYGGEDSEKEGSASVRVAQMMPLPLTNDIGVTFEDMYGSRPLPIVLIDYDWLTFRRFGQWILSVGTGIGQAEGPGRFKDDKTEANERYTFYVLLNHISFTYRFQYTDHPWFVPYFSGGAIPAVLAERRDDNKRNKSKFVPGAHVTGGVRMNIGKLDTYGAASLDSEYGINNMWVDVEFRRVQALNNKIDISSNLINLGLGFDF